MKINRKNKTLPAGEQITIHGMSHDGRGIGKINNITTFVAGALPNELVTCTVSKKKGAHYEAQLDEVLQASTDRVTPPCEHFGLCGGCSLQHMSDAAQIQLKQQTLVEQLEHFGKVTADTLLPPLTAQSTGYRLKARLGAKFVIKKDKLLVGFREKSSRYLADINNCEVLHPKIGHQLTELATLIRSISCYEHIPQVEFAMGDHEAALIFRHMKPLTDEDISKLIQFGKEYQFHIYLQGNPPAKVQKIYPDDNIERLEYSLPNQNLTFRFHPMDFTQVNLQMNRLMITKALDLLQLQPDEKVLDLYCGIGNFSLAMARHAKHVTGIEGSKEMTERALENAALNQISNVSFDAANLEEPPAKADWMQCHYDKILLDPPRAGAKEMLPYFSKLGAKKIVYVSCNPATLARDAGELVHLHGYRLSAAGIMNMFPHTAHAEAIAVFDKE